MKHYILISRNEETIYEGRMINIPLKEASVTKKSILLFDDEDPCIIHKSYVVKTFVDEMLELFKKTDNNVISGEQFESDLDFVDFPNIKELKLKLKG